MVQQQQQSSPSLSQSHGFLGNWQIGQIYGGREGEGESSCT